MPARTPSRPADQLERIVFETTVLGRHLGPTNDAAQSYLDRSVYTLLSRIDLEGAMTIGQLSDAFRLDVSTLNRQTARLVKQGLMRRIPDPDGGMARKFELTPTGRSRLDRDRTSRVTALTEILDGWEHDDVELLASLLERFNQSIERRDGRPWPRHGTPSRRGDA